MSVRLKTPASTLRVTYLLLVVGALAAACGASESARSGGPTMTTVKKSLDSLTLVPGVVVEPTRGSVYLMRPAGGIDSLTIDDGRLLWTSDHADQPLLVGGDHVLAMVDSASSGLVVAFLDPDNGKPASKAQEPLVLALPTGVTAGIDQTLERRFTHTVRESAGEAYLTWGFLQQEVTGVAPPGGRSPEHRERGAFRVSGDTLEAVAPDSVFGDSQHWPAELKEQVESQRVRRPPLSTGEVFAIAEQRYEPEQVILRRWRTSDGKSLEVKLLYEGRAVAVLASCDEQHVVVATAGAQAGAERPYLLRYYDVNNAALVAKLPSTRSAGPFCLLDSRLLQLSQPELRRVDGAMVATPLALVAIDVATGGEVWRRVVRDTAFRGVAPPGS